MPKKPYGSWPILIFLVYGIFLLWFLFFTVHDRKGGEFIERMDSRWPTILQVWINHGYSKHGGMAFMQPVDQKPDQKVWRSNSIFFLQLGHVLERIHIAFKGEFSYVLLAVHNQIIPMFSSCLLGFLAMRLVLKRGSSFNQAIILGLCAQTVYQTFPFNLILVWGISQHATSVILLLAFLILEEGGVSLKYGIKRSIARAVLVFFMGINEPSSTLFFFLAYIVVKILTCPESINFWKKMWTNILSFSTAIVVIFAQLFWVKSNYPQVVYGGSELFPRTGFDGDLTYYYDHMDLLGNRYLLNLPGWHALLFSGLLAILIVLTLIQRKRVSLFQQTTLLSLVGLFVLYAFLLSQSSVIHSSIYDNYLAIPAILALFALLPAWFELILQRFKYMFVVLSVVLAFVTAGLQMFAYWVYMPPLFLI